jgi:hypothetical protein
VGLGADSVLVPVHKACIDLYKQHLSGNLPASSRFVDKICADALKRLLADYEDVLSIDPDVSLAFDMCAQAESLEGHYGALKPFEWVTEINFILPVKWTDSSTMLAVAITYVMNPAFMA